MFDQLHEAIYNVRDTKIESNDDNGILLLCLAFERAVEEYGKNVMIPEARRSGSREIE